MSANNVETKLRQAYAEQLEFLRKHARKQRAEAKDVFKLRPIAEKLATAGIDFSVYATMIFVRTDCNEGPRTKSVFSELVKRVASVLGEQPDIDVGPKRYTADFKNSKVYLSMLDAEDCQLIETEETITRKVMKPHPMCLAALKELEDIA